MWMSGYTEGVDFNSRKLRPLMPRPVVAASACVSPPGLTRIYGHDLLALNHHFATAEQNKLSGNNQQVLVSSRWNPTPEQLETLEELYRRGTRTPSAEQIQNITADLRRYGKIEGKNVFYWFQNHKARERQKRRRQLESTSDEQPHGEKKESSSGANRKAIEVEQTKNWAFPSNSRTISEKTVGTQRAASASASAAESESKGITADRWLQFDQDAESQQGRNATWHLSYSRSSTSLIMNSSNSAANTSTVQSTPATTTGIVTHPHDFIDVFSENLPHSAADGGLSTEDGRTAAQTLQLFPLQNDDEDHEAEAMTGANEVTAYQFFEFLPLKN